MNKPEIKKKESAEPTLAAQRRAWKAQLSDAKKIPQIRQAGSAEAFLDFLPLAGNAVIFPLLFVPVNHPESVEQ